VLSFLLVFFSDQTTVFGDHSNARGFCRRENEHNEYRTECCPHHHKIKGKHEVELSSFKTVASVCENKRVYREDLNYTV